MCLMKVSEPELLSNPHRLRNEMMSMMSAKTHGCVTPPHRTPEGTPCKRPSCAQCAAGVALGAEVFMRVVTCGARYRGPLIPNPESRCYSMPHYAFPCGWTCFKYALAALESDRCACRNDNIHLCLLSDVLCTQALRPGM